MRSTRTRVTIFVRTKRPTHVGLSRDHGSLITATSRIVSKSIVLSLTAYFDSKVAVALVICMTDSVVAFPAFTAVVISLFGFHANPPKNKISLMSRD